MMPVDEFVVKIHIERRIVESWIAAGWLMPQRDPELAFSEVDLARAQLIRELKEDFGVNDEGISLVLHLLDQVHGLRRSMRELLEQITRN
jgi:chaperone modulatory protein CbpM